MARAMRDELNGPEASKPPSHASTSSPHQSTKRSKKVNKEYVCRLITFRKKGMRRFREYCGRLLGFLLGMLGISGRGNEGATSCGRF